MEKYFLIPKQFVKIVRCICTRKSEVLTGMSDFITQDAFQKWLPVIFHLLALWTSFCGTKSVVYSCVRRVCVWKCRCSVIYIFHVVSANYNAGNNKNKQNSCRRQGRRALRLWNYDADDSAATSFPAPTSEVNKTRQKHMNSSTTRVHMQTCG